MMPGRGKGGAHKVRHLKAKQQKKKFIRSKDPILSVFMWGVQHSVSKLAKFKLWHPALSS